jgi:hypothetical protein
MCDNLATTQCRLRVLQHLIARLSPTSQQLVMYNITAQIIMLLATLHITDINEPLHRTRWYTATQVVAFVQALVFDERVALAAVEAMWLAIVQVSTSFAQTAPRGT